MDIFKASSNRTTSSPIVYACQNKKYDTVDFILQKTEDLIKPKRARNSLITSLSKVIGYNLESLLNKARLNKQENFISVLKKIKIEQKLLKYAFHELQQKISNLSIFLRGLPSEKQKEMNVTTNKIKNLNDILFKKNPNYKEISEEIPKLQIQLKSLQKIRDNATKKVKYQRNSECGYDLGYNSCDDCRRGNYYHYEVVEKKVPDLKKRNMAEKKCFDLNKQINYLEEKANNIIQSNADMSEISGKISQLIKEKNICADKCEKANNYAIDYEKYEKNTTAALNKFLAEGQLSQGLRYPKKFEPILNILSEALPDINFKPYYIHNAYAQLVVVAKMIKQETRSADSFFNSCPNEVLERIVAHTVYPVDDSLHESDIKEKDIQEVFKINW